MSNKKQVQVDENLVDEISEEIDTLETWIIEHWKKVLIIGCVIIAVIAVVAGFGQLQKSQKAKAIAALANADTQEAISKAIAKYPNLSATDAARLRLAAIYTEKKDYKKAIEVIKQVAESTSATPFMKTRALLDVAVLTELDGDTANALSAFEALANNPLLLESQRAEATFSAGRLYADKGDVAQARKLLGSLTASANSGKSMDVLVWGQLALPILNRLPAATETPAAGPAIVPNAVPAPAPAIAPAAAAPAK